VRSSCPRWRSRGHGAGVALLAFACLGAGGDRPPDLDLGVEHPARARGLRLGAGAGPALFVEVTKKSTVEGVDPTFDNYAGGAAAITLSYSYGLDTELMLSAIAEPATSSAGTLAALGGRVGARVDLAERVFAGLGFTVGYLVTPDEPVALPMVYEPRSSIFLAPDLEPFGLRLGADKEIDLSIRLRVLFASQDDLGGRVHAPVFFSPMLGATYFLTP
jgi:hypothetical protein